METQTPTPTVIESIPSVETILEPSTTQSNVSGFPKKKILFAIIGAVLVGTLIVLALYIWGQFHKNSITTTVAQPITLVYWGMLEEDANLKIALQQFEQQNPGVTVEYSQQSPKDYYNRLTSACARGQCPDLFSFHSTWTKPLYRREMLSLLPGSILSTSQYQQIFYPVVTSDLQVSGGYAGIPLSIDGLGLYVNKRILQASGKPVPVTWDELRNLADQLTIQGNDGSIAQSGAALGTTTNMDHFSDILAILILQNSGNPVKPEAFASSTHASSSSNGQVSLVGDALTFYTQFSRDDKVWNDTMPNSTYAFAIGKAAMIFAPAYRAAEIKKINPNFDFAVYPIPQLPGKPVTLANYWAEGVSKTSTQSQVAWKLLAFLSSKSVQQQLFVTSDQVPTHLSARQDLQAEISANPYVGAIAAQLPNAKTSYMSSRTFDDGINDKLSGLYADVVTKMNAGALYQDLAPKFSQDVQQLGASYGIIQTVGF